MSRGWTEKQSYNLVGKLFGMKYRGYELYLISAEKNNDIIRIEYLFEKEGQIDSIEIKAPQDGTIPSAVDVFPRGAWMQREITQRYGIRFKSEENAQKLKPGYSFIEWGPFHPLLPEPVLFGIFMKDEVIDSININTGYNFRGIEELCEGEKPADVLEMLERTSFIDGITAGIAFSCAVEKINNIEVPEKAKWIRMILNEMSSFKANLYNLNQVALCLELLSESSRIFRLIDLFNEVAAQIGDHPQLMGITKIGGIGHDISKGSLYAANAIFQDMKAELTRVETKWINTPSIYKRLKTTGFISEKTAKQMAGRIARGAGFEKDARKYSELPYNFLSYKVVVGEKSNCFSRAMLLLNDLLLSISLVEQGVENLPESDICCSHNIAGNGKVLVREQGAYGEMAVLVSQEDGNIKYIKTRNTTALNFPFLSDAVKGIELTDLPLVAASFDLDLSGMEK